MTEQTTETTETVEPAKPATLEELLADLDDDRRTAILGTVSKARNEAKGLRQRVKDLEPKAQQFDTLAAASQTAEDRLAAVQADADKRSQAANARIARAEVKALASQAFADPEDAIAFLDLSTYVDADGDVDSAAIKADLVDLLARKPHLAVAPGGPRAPRPDRSQASGAAGGAALSPRDEFAALIQGSSTGR